MGEARQRKLAREAGQPWSRDKPVEFKFRFRSEVTPAPAIASTEAIDPSNEGEETP